MNSVQERLVTAQWLLERQLQWVAAADVKVGVVVAIDTAMLGGLAAAYASTQDHTGWAIAMSVLTLVLNGAGMFCTSAAVFPRLDGPPDSLLYFGKVAATKPVAYMGKLAQATDEELLRDWSTQIHRNAMIAKLKHGWVKIAILWSFFSVPFWIAAVALLVKY